MPRTLDKTKVTKWFIEAVVGCLSIAAVLVFAFLLMWASMFSAGAVLAAMGETTTFSVILSAAAGLATSGVIGLVVMFAFAYATGEFDK